MSNYTNILQILPRLLIGIGRPDSRSEVTDYVLETITSEDRQVIDSAIDTSIHMLLQHIEQKHREQ